MCSAPQPMMRPRCSATTKSRTFSQTSPYGRGSSVPSPEYMAIRSHTAGASFTIALRVRIGFLRSSEYGDAPLCLRDRLAHARGRGAAHVVMLGQHLRQRQRRGEVVAELRRDLLQFVEW